MNRFFRMLTTVGLTIIFALSTASTALAAGTATRWAGGTALLHSEAHDAVVYAKDKSTGKVTRIVAKGGEWSAKLLPGTYTVSAAVGVKNTKCRTAKLVVKPAPGPGTVSTAEVPTVTNRCEYFFHAVRS